MDVLGQEKVGVTRALSEDPLIARDKRAMNGARIVEGVSGPPSTLLHYSGWGGFDMPETNLQAFVRSLYKAHAASEAVDHVDLRSDDDASLRKWNGLLEKQRAAFLALHKICRTVPVDALIDEE